LDLVAVTTPTPSEYSSGVVDAQPVATWLWKVGLATAVVGGLLLGGSFSVLRRIGPVDVHVGRRWEVLLYAALVASCLAAAGVATLASPDSVLQWKPLGLLPLMAAAGAWSERNRRRELRQLRRDQAAMDPPPPPP
jgi:hypothetical protein